MVASCLCQMSTPMLFPVGIDDTNWLVKDISHRQSSRDEVGIIGDDDVFLAGIIEAIQEQLHSYVYVGQFFFNPFHLNHLWRSSWWLATVTIRKRKLWEQDRVGGEKCVCMDSHQRQCSKCPQIQILALRCARIVVKTYYTCGEVPNEMDVRARQQHLAHCLQVKPSILSSFERAIVEIEAVNVDVRT